METSLFLVWLVSVLSFGGHPSPVLANLDTEKLSLSHFAYNAAIEASIDPRKFVRLQECESKMSMATGDNGNAYGPMQFWKGTFNTYKNKYGATDLRYRDPYDQISLAAIMIRDGGWKHWYNCGKIMGYDPTFASLP